MKECHKLEEVFWTYRPKYQHVNCYRLAIPLSRLSIDVELEVIQLVCKGLANGRVGLVGDRRLRPTIIPALFREL